MGIRTLLKRIEQAEKALKNRSIFPADCICFPENEQPFFCSLSEEKGAAEIKCPLHGYRFKRPQFFIYVASWRRVTESAQRQRLSAQYRKAWAAGNPPNFPPTEQRQEPKTGRSFPEGEPRRNKKVGEV